MILAQYGVASIFRRNITERSLGRILIELVTVGHIASQGSACSVLAEELYLMIVRTLGVCVTLSSSTPALSDRGDPEFVVIKDLISSGLIAHVLEARACAIEA